MIATLVEAGADVQAKAVNGVTPLHLAAVPLEPAMVAELREKGAAIDTGANATAATIGALLDAGADLEASTADLRTPLHAAASLGNVAAVTLLIERGANLNTRDESDGTPLHAAVSGPGHEGDPEMLRRLGIDIDSDSAFAKSALKGFLHTHAIATETNPAVVEALVGAGADIEARDRLDATPLHRAAATANAAAIVALLDAGADPTARTALNKTPWHLAEGRDELKGTEAYRRLRDGRER